MIVRSVSFWARGERPPTMGCALPSLRHTLFSTPVEGQGACPESQADFQNPSAAMAGREPRPAGLRQTESCGWAGRSPSHRPAGWCKADFVHPQRWRNHLDCYWVGSLDFSFLGNQVGFSTKPPKSYSLFAGGSLQHPRKTSWLCVFSP